jgi:iron complex transport system substrate-binding protein
MSRAMRSVVNAIGRGWRRPFVAASLIAILIAPAAARADGPIVRDAAGRTVTVSDASRIVSIGGAVTEILYALGLKDHVVAVDTTSLYPPQALKEKPNVGYMRSLWAEGVHRLKT